MWQPQTQTNTAVALRAAPIDDRPYVVLLGRSFFNDPTYKQGTARRTRVAVGKIVEALDGSNITISSGLQGSDIEAMRIEEIAQNSDRETTDERPTLLARIREAQDTITFVEETYSAHRSFVNDNLLPYSLQLSRHIAETAGIHTTPVGLFARSAVNMVASLDNGFADLPEWKAYLMGKTERGYSPEFEQEHTLMRLTWQGRSRIGMREDPEYTSIFKQLLRGVPAEECLEAFKERAETLYAKGAPVGLASFFVEDLFTRRYQNGPHWGFLGEEQFLEFLELANKEESSKGVRFCGFDTKTLRVLDELQKKDLPEYSLEYQPREKYMQDPWSRQLATFLAQNPFDTLPAREKKLVLLCYDIGYQNAFERKFSHIRALRGEADPSRYADAKAVERQITECDYLMYCLTHKRTLSDTRGMSLPQFTIDRLNLLERLVSA